METAAYFSEQRMAHRRRELAQQSVLAAAAMIGALVLVLAIL
jgi:hypothetical protein